VDFWLSVDKIVWEPDKWPIAAIGVERETINLAGHYPDQVVVWRGRNLEGEDIPLRDFVYMMHRLHRYGNILKVDRPGEWDLPNFSLIGSGDDKCVYMVELPMKMRALFWWQPMHRNKRNQFFMCTGWDYEKGSTKLNWSEPRQLTVTPGVKWKQTIEKKIVAFERQAAENFIAGALFRTMGIDMDSRLSPRKPGGVQDLVAWLRYVTEEETGKTFQEVQQTHTCQSSDMKFDDVAFWFNAYVQAVRGVDSGEPIPVRTFKY
jgi:hypothetical protein